jgi:hypothetical protein
MAQLVAITYVIEVNRPDPRSWRLRGNPIPSTPRAQPVKPSLVKTESPRRDTTTIIDVPLAHDRAWPQRTELDRNFATRS